MPRPKTDTDPYPCKLTASFTEEMYEWLRRKAFDERIAIRELIRCAVEEYRKVSK